MAEPLVFLCIGLPLLWAGGADGPLLAKLSAGSGDSVGALPAVCYEYGLILVLLGALSYGLARSGNPLLATAWMQVRNGSASSRPSPARLPRMAVAALMLALLAGVLLRVALLSQPVFYDEAFNYLTFVHGRPSRLFYYPLPNNHILNTLLVKLVTLAFGDSPEVLRLPALASGLLLIPLVFRVCRKLSPEPGAGIFAASVAAVLPYLVLYSTVCRGYALLCLLLVAMIDAALDRDGRCCRDRVAVVALLGAMGMLAMPSMLFAIGGTGLWMILVDRAQGASGRQILQQIALPLAGLTVFFTAILYLPAALVNGGLSNVMSNRFFNPLPTAEFLQAIPGHATATLSALATGIGPVGGLALVALAIAGPLEAWRQGRVASALLLPAMLAGCIAMFLLKRSIPFERTWIFLIPVLLIAADGGFLVLLRRLGLPSAAVALPALMIVPLAFALAASPARHPLPEMGTVPEAAAISTALAREISSRDIVCVSLPADAPVHYYLLRALSESTLPPSASARVLIVQQRGAVFRPDSGTITPIGDVGGYSILRWDSRSITLDRLANCWLPAIEQRNPAAIR